MLVIENFSLILNLILIITTTSSILLIQADTSIPRPHGVSFLKASFYLPGDTNSWSCLDGEKTIKYTQINDDYCDCEDGSDEPGTSACLMGEFHCANRGYKPQNIISSRVNDGICDCCDGSDELVEGELNNCANNCLELGRLEQEELRNKADLHKRGAVRRSEMVSKGKKLKIERESRQLELEHQKAQQLTLKLEKEDIKRQAEELESKAIEFWKEQQQELNPPEKLLDGEHLANSEEAHLVFQRLDGNKDGFVDITELQVDIILDRDNNGVVQVEEAKYFLDERERVDFDSFLTIAWPRVKTQQLVHKGLFPPPVVTESTGQPELEGTEEQQEQHLDHTGEEEEAESDDGHREEEEEEEDVDGDADVGVGTATNEQPNPEYDPETQHLVEQANAARSAFQQAETALRDIEMEIKEINDLNEKDYGINEEYAVLDSQCFSFEDREYVYSLCPFDRASQKQRNGQSETTLGRWEGWWHATGHAKYQQQRYTHGAACWNGPQRSANVVLRCGVEERITSVSEPNRCEYLFEFETPAACYELNTHTEDMHDEL